MRDNGYYDEYTGNKEDGNFYCKAGGDQVPVGFKHHHASEVPALKKKIASLEKLVAATKPLSLVEHPEKMVSADYQWSYDPDDLEKPL